MSGILFFVLGLLFQCFVYGQQGKGQVQVLLEKKNVEHDYSLGLLQKVSEGISLDMIFPSDEYMCHVENVRMTLKNLSPGMNELLKQKNEKVMLEGFKRYLEHMKQVIEESRPDMRRNMRGNLQRLFINFFGLIQKGLMAKINSCESPRQVLPATNKTEPALPAVPVENKQENYDNIDVNKAEEIFLSNTLLEIAVQCKSTGNNAKKQLNFLGSFSKCSFSASAVSNSFFSKASGENGNANEGINKSLELENQLDKHLEELQKIMNFSKLYSDIFFPHIPQLRSMNSQVVTSEQKDETNGNRNSVESLSHNELYPEVSSRDLNNFQKILEAVVQNAETPSTETSESSDGKQDGENKNELKNFNLLTANILDELAKTMQEESTMSSDNKNRDTEYNEKLEKGLDELDALFDKKLPYEMQLSDIEAVASQLSEQMIKNGKEEEEASKQQTTQEATGSSNSN